MGKKILTFEDIEIEKKKILPQQDSYFLKDVDIGKVLASNKIYFGEKTVLLVTCTMIIKPLHTMLPKTSVYVKSYDGQTK